MYNFGVTLTGVDKYTNIEKLMDLSQKYPFVEWGILYSEVRQGAEFRYPYWKWIQDTFLEEIINRNIDINLAFHLCGSIVQDFIKGTHRVKFFYDLEEQLLEPNADINLRYQLNFNLKKTPIENQSLIDCIKHQPCNVVTQHNKSNASVVNLPLTENHQILFDASGGRGVGPVQWNEPFPNKFCGYAGGLGPDNVVQELEKILTFFPDIDMPLFWIDMETKIRTDDHFDLDKCEQVLKAVEPFIKEV